MKNPQEEPKQDLEKKMFELEQQLDIPYHLRWHNSKPKQEKLYSEEEVEQLIHRAVHDSHCRPNRVKHANSNECAAFVNEWFEQFKKK